MFKRLLVLLLVVVLCLAPGSVFSQSGEESGYIFFKNYRGIDYDNDPQNWAITQDKLGIIYVANHGGLLQFDGISWRSFHIPNHSVYSLTVDKHGILFIGGRNEIGFMAPDASGTLQYNSLTKHLSDEQKKFGNVWAIHATKEGVYFQTSHYLFFWLEGKFKIKESGSKKNLFHTSFFCGGKLYIRQYKVGLLQAVNGSLKLLPEEEKFARLMIYFMATYDEKKLLIGTRKKGFFLFDGTNLEPFPTEVDDLILKKELYHGIRLKSSPGQFALATRQGGVIIIDASGRLKAIFDTSNYLSDRGVKHVFEGFQGNLWLALNRGISKIEYNSPLSIFDEQSGLPGMVLSVEKHSGTLYAGTYNGLFLLSPGGRFKKVLSISSPCWDMISTGKSLLAGTTHSLLQIEENSYEKVLKNRSYVLLRSRKEPRRVWVGTRRGLVSLYLESGRWQEEHRFKQAADEIRTMSEDKNGSLWLGPLPKGVIKIDFPIPGTINNPVVSRYGKGHGLPEQEIRVFWAADHVIFASDDGLFRFDEQQKQFIPDLTLKNKFDDNNRDVLSLSEDRNGHICYHSMGHNIEAIPQSDDTYQLNKKPFLRLPGDRVHAIYPGKEKIWFAADTGLIRFDREFKKDYDLPFNALVRKVWINEKEAYSGRETAKINMPVIEYKDRNLRFQFAAPFFEGEEETRYSCFLEGYDKDWSAWTKDTKASYTNLDAGDYNFRVRAKNIYENISREDTFGFKVQPPWFQTWWAYSIYALAGISLVFLIVRWRSGKHRREKEKLELVVKERTKEIGEKNIQLEEQSEKLKEMDTIKSRFFANISHEFRTPLTLILGPLEQMIDACPQNEEDRKRKLTLIFRNAQRLLRLINQLLELSKLDSGRMKLQACETGIITFIKGIVDSFRVLTQQKELELVFSVEQGDNENAEEISLYIDPRKMEDIMSNLLVNAMKFTPPGGQVRVTIKRLPAGSALDSVPSVSSTAKKVFQAGFVEISVCDTGPGIPSEQLAFIFDRFYQADSTYEFHEKGSGIGLALCKELVELHHGIIEAANREEGGSRFIIRLPVGSAHLAAGEITEYDEAQDFASGGQGAFLKNRPLDPQKTFDNFTSAASDRETKEIILVVEDSAEMRDYIRCELEPVYTVIEAEDGRRGIEKARETIPDLIISDVMMPEINGYELCRTVKTDVKTSHIPVILLTAKASDESVVAGLETGADDYVTKPFKTKILLARIKNLIDIRAQLQKNINREMTLQPVKTAVSKLDREFLKDLNVAINKNLPDEDFNVEKLSKKLYMGRTSLYRKVLALTGLTPTEFIRSYRLKRGAELLKQGPISVLEVAFEVGFSDSSYFSKCFKEKFHQLPSEYQTAKK